MTCQEARIQAYLDGELSRDERKELSRHLESCKPCQTTLAELKRLGEWSEQALHDALAPLPNEEDVQIDAHAAWATFEAKLQARQEAKHSSAFVTTAVPLEPPRLERPIARPTTSKKGRWSTMAKAYQKWIAGGAAAAVVVGALMIPQVQAATSDLLHLFRVEKFQMITFDQSDLTSIQNFIKDGKIGERDLDGLGKVEMTGDKNAVPTTYSAADAQKLGLVSVAAPSGYVLKNVQVSPSRNMKLTVDVKKMNSLLQSLGSKVTFDENLDNKPFSIAIPQDSDIVFQSKSDANVTLHYGASASPQLQVPADVDVKKLRATVLGLPFLPAHIKQQLASIEDWQKTMPIPALEGGETGAVTEKVTVDGTEAIYAEMGGNNSMLMWQKGGKIYRLSLQGWNPQAGNRKQALLKQAEQYL